MILRRVLVVSLAIWALHAAVCAQSIISREVVASGGMEMENGVHHVIGTVGQAVTGMAAVLDMTVGQGFWYKVTSVSTGVHETDPIPASPVLHQNYPNPFGQSSPSGSSSTVIEFTLPARSHVTLEIFGASGERIATLIDGAMDGGRKLLRFMAGTLAPGLYFYRLTAGSFRAERKMLLLK